MSSLYTDPQQLHDDLIDHIIFGDWSIDEFSEHFDENVSMIHTGAHERITNQTEVVDFVSSQLKELGGLSFEWTRIPIYARYNAQGNVFLVEEDSNVDIKDTHQTVIMRVTCINEKNQGRLAMHQTLAKIKVDMRITTTYPIYHG